MMWLRNEGKVMAGSDEVEKYPHVRWELLKEFPTLGAALKEIERLRAAGDALALSVRAGRLDDALDVWEEIRGR